VFKDINAANPDMKLFGPDGVAEGAFSEKLGSKVEKQVFITNPTLDPKLYPPAAQDFFKEFKSKYGKDPEPYAIYGFEAMNLVIEAIKAGGDDRAKVVEAFFAIKGRDSVLGTYDIDENGDTTLSDYGGNRIEGGKLTFDKVIKAATS
jgi:branched-chain amino acid transport system substrate-binding protein